MKFLVLAAVVALASAEVSQNLRSDESQAPIVRSEYEIYPEGSFNYGYETANGIVAGAEGVVTNPNSEAASLNVKGHFRYTAPDGSLVEATYQADENGFRPESSAIPVPPAIPELILRSLEYIASHPPPAEYAKKTTA